MNNKEKIEAIGIDYDDVMMRFASQEQLYMKFLKRFCQDSSYTTLISAYQTHDHKVIEQSAHTLKGVSANLGLKELSQACEDVVLDVRKEQDEDVLSADLMKLQVIYEDIILKVRTLVGE